MEKSLTPIRAIRKYCLGCMNGSAHEVKLCPVDYCELFEYRLGTNPHIAKRTLTEEEKAKKREILKKAQEARQRKEP